MVSDPGGVAALLTQLSSIRFVAGLRFGEERRRQGRLRRGSSRPDLVGLALRALGISLHELNYKWNASYAPRRDARVPSTCFVLRNPMERVVMIFVNSGPGPRHWSKGCQGAGEERRGEGSGAEQRGAGVSPNLWL